MPRWFTTIRTSGHARARSASSPSCVWYAIASNENPRRPSVRTPSRNDASASSPARDALFPIGDASHAVLSRTPRNRPRPAASSASIPAGPRPPASGRRDRRWPAIGGPSPRRSASSATAATHSTSPTGRSSTGPSVRYCEWHSTNTVRTTRWPEAVSARNSSNGYGATVPRASQRWWCASQIGRSGSSTTSVMGRPYAVARSARRAGSGRRNDDDRGAQPPRGRPARRPERGGANAPPAVAASGCSPDGPTTGGGGRRGTTGRAEQRAVTCGRDSVGSAC